MTLAGNIRNVLGFEKKPGKQEPSFNEVGNLRQKKASIISVLNILQITKYLETNTMRKQSKKKQPEQRFKCPNYDIVNS